MGQLAIPGFPGKWPLKRCAYKFLNKTKMLYMHIGSAVLEIYKFL